MRALGVSPEDGPFSVTIALLVDVDDCSLPWMVARCCGWLPAEAADAEICDA